MVPSKVRNQMAHLPREVRDEVIPFIVSLLEAELGLVYTFDCRTPEWREYGKQRGDANGIEILNSYHFWMTSEDQLDHKMLEDLESRIKRFNKANRENGLVLHVEAVDARSEEHRVIRRSDSDLHGSYYLLVTATREDGFHFPYTVPEGMVRDDCLCLFNGVAEMTKAGDKYIVPVAGDEDHQVIMVSDAHYEEWDELRQYLDAIVHVGTNPDPNKKMAKRKTKQYKKHVEIVGKFRDLFVRYVDPVDRFNELLSRLLDLEPGTPAFTECWVGLQKARSER